MSKPIRIQLSRKQIISELRGEIRVYQDSYHEADGRVHNRGALRTIAALSQAIELLKTK